MKLTRLLRTALLVSLAVGFNGGAWAQGNSHNKNSGNTQWINNGGWDTGNIPGPADTAIINSGLLTVSGAQSIGRVRLNGGNLAGAVDAATDSLTINGSDSNSEWSQGTLQDITLLIGENAILDIEGSAAKSLSNAVLVIESGDGHGLVNWTEGQLRLNNNSKIENSGNFDDSASDLITTVSGGTGTFNNLADGEYHKLASGTTEIDVAFHNSGIVNIDVGTLILDGSGTNSAAGQFAADDGTEVIFHSDFAVADASKLTGAGQYSLQAGSLTLDGTVNAANLQIEGGSLKGVHTFTNGATWTGGSLSAGTTTNASGSVFTLQDSGGNILNDHDIINQTGGTINWAAGNIDARSGSTITNQGTFNDTADAFFQTNSGSAGSFTNTSTGTYNKNGPGTTGFDRVFDNDGTVNITNGILVLDGTGTASATGSFLINSGTVLKFDNNYTVVDAASLTGSGEVKVTGGTLDIDGQISVPDLRVDGGSLSGDHTFSAGATIANGTFAAGTTTNAGGSTLNLSDSGNNTLSERHIVNQAGGTINWTAGNIDARSGSTITNQGTFNDTADAFFQTNSGAAGSFANTFTGTYNKNGSGTTEFDRVFDNDGTVNVNAGTLKLDGGGTTSATGSFAVSTGASLLFDNDYTIADAANLTGTGGFKATGGTVNLNGQVNVSDFRIEGSTLTGDQTFNHGATLQSGRFDLGSTTNASTSVLNLAHASTNILTDRDIINQSGGTVNWTSGNIDVRSGSTITNEGTFNDTADALFQTNSGVAGSLTNTSTGAYNKNGSGTTEFDRAFNNDGSVNVNAGTLKLDGGGTASSTGSFDVAAGATLQFDNNYTIADGQLLAGSGDIKATAGTFDLSSQVQHVTLLIEGATVVGTHSFHQGATLTNGSFGAGQTTVSNNSTLNLSDAGGNTLTDRDIYIQPGSTLNWTTGNINANSGSFIFMQGTLNDTADAHFTTLSGSGEYLTMSGGSTYNKNGPGTTELDSTFHNFGTVNVNAGILILDGGGQAGSTALFNVADGATLKFDSNYTVADAATLVGLGKYLLSAQDLELDGVLSVDFEQDGGDLDGSFSIGGTFDWQDGSWNADVVGETTTINSSGVLNMNDTTHFYNNRHITNEGTVNWSGGTMLSNDGGSFTNNGLFKDLSDDDHNISESSGSSTFTNNGTYRKTGAGTTRIDQTFNSSSPRTLDVQNGILELNGGGTNFAGGAMVVQGSGLIRFTSSYEIDDAADLSTSSLSGAYGYELEGGELDLNGQLNVDFLQTGGELEGSQTINATYDLVGGDWDADSDGATTTIASTGVFNINPEGSQNPDYDNRDIINHGIVNWKDGDLDTTSTGSFVNHATFNDQTDHDHEIGETSGQATFTNHGTFNKTGDSNTEIYQDFDQNGVLNIDAGQITLRDGSTMGASASTKINSDASLVVRAGIDITPGATITGEGTFRAEGGTVTGEAEFGAGFEHAGATLDGDFNFANQWTYSSGTVAAGRNIDLVDGAFGKIDTLAFLDLTDSELAVDSDSSLQWSAGTIRTGSDGGLAIEGFFTTDFDGEINQDLTGDGYVDISGEFRKTGGSETTTFDLPVTVSGRFEAHTGTVALTAGGTSNAGLFDVWSGATINFSQGFTFNDGTTVRNGGDLNLNGGTFAINDTVSLGQHASINGGIITGTHTLGGQVVIDGGVFDSAGTTTIASKSSLEFAHPEDNPLERSFVNNGKILWSDGDMTGSGTNSLINNGEFAVSTDGTLGAPNDDFTITNNGTFQKIDGNGTTMVDLPFTNNGIVGSDTGILHFADSFTFGSGQLALGGGQITFAQTLSFPATAALTGNGTITGNVETGGFVSPGNSIGSISIAGDLTLLTSSISFFEVDASSTGSSDMVSVSGNLTLGGSLTWNLLSSVDPISTDMFTLFTANNLTGAFLNAPSGSRIAAPGGQRSFVINYGSSSGFDPNSVIFSDFEFSPVPEPSTWALMVTGLMIIGWQGRRRRK